MVQWLRPSASNVRGAGLTPVGGTKIWHASLYNPPQKIIIMQKCFLRQCLAHTSTSGLVAAIITATIISAIMVMMIMILLKDLFIYSFLVTKGLRYCPWAFCSCSEQGLLFTFRAQDSYCDGFSCCRAQTPELWLSGCGTRAYGIFLDQGLTQCPLHWQAHS